MKDSSVAADFMGALGIFGALLVVVLMIVTILMPFFVIRINDKLTQTNKLLKHLIKLKENEMGLDE